MAVFSKEQQNSVWEKGIIVDGYDPNIVRKDACGAWILKSKYDVHDSPFGWQIDHIYPASKLFSMGMSQELIDDLQNLRPLNIRNYISKKDDYPIYKAVMTSKDNENIDCNDIKQVNLKLQAILKQLYKL